MTDHPVLDVTVPTGDVRGVALVLHGGRSRSHAPTRPWQLAVLRMVPFAKALHDGDPDGLAVARLRFRMRGWNGAEQSPVHDARWALDELTGRFPDVPVALVGHSMGGRTALHVAGHDAVRVVVGLAPWVEEGDFGTVSGLAGRRVLIAHGDRDRMTDPRASAAYARAAAPIAASVSYVTVTDAKHAMLGRADVWQQLAAGFVLGALWRDAGTGQDVQQNSDPAPGPVAGVLADALAGQPALVV